MNETQHTPAPKADKLMTAKEVAGYMDISQRHLFRLKARGLIPYIQLSPGSVRYRRADLERALNKLSTAAQ